MSPEYPLQVIAADATERNVLIVDFSDGTTAYIPVEQLLKLRANRIRTAYFPPARSRVVSSH